MRRPASLLVSALVLAVATPAAGSPCPALVAEAAALEQRGGNAFAVAAARQRAELFRAEALAARCGFIGAAGCADLPRRLGAMRANFARLDAAARRAGGGASAGRRARLLAAMRREGCRGALATPAPASRPSGGLLAFLGFAQVRPEPEFMTRTPPPVSSREGPAERALRRRIEAPDSDADPAPLGFGRGPYRTLCVRSCDGYFWPVSYSVPSAAFERDEALCRAACPNLDVSLYVHRNPGGSSAEAISLFGQPYAQLPNAYRFRERFDPACYCRPAPPDTGADTMRAGFTPIPRQPPPLPPRSAEVPLVISTGRVHTSDRLTGSEGLRGVYPERAGALTPDGR